MKSTTKNLLSRLHSGDGRIFISLVAVIVLLAVGGVKLSHVVATDMLRTDARSTSSNWVATMMENVDVPTLITGPPPFAS